MKKKMTKKQLLNSFYSNITNKLIAAINNGATSWLKCWKDIGVTGLPHNGTTNTPYKGINIIALWCAGYADTRWGTYKQISEKGGQVRKGEKGTKVIFWKPLKIDEVQSDGSTVEKMTFTFRIYTVFNFSQCDGLPAAPAAPVAPKNTLNKLAESYLAGEKIQCSFGGNRAFYSPKKDYIKLPNQNQFKTDLHFDCTLFHEIAHSTGHKSRLAREGVTQYNYFGSHKYSYEELVAELTAVFSMCKLGMMDETSDIFENSAAYLSGWAAKLGDHPEWLNKAAKEATKATDYIFQYKS